MNLIKPNITDISANNPIGIFDSGIGGLTVANAVLKRLPNDRLVYFGDTAHLPYGDKSSHAIRHYAEKICEFLVAKGCKIIVVACNSASSAAWQHLQKVMLDRVLLVNVIDPVTQFVAARGDLHTVGVIGTRATIRAGAYRRKLNKLRTDLKVRSQATPLLAQMIEEGFYHNNISRAVVRSYLDKSRFKDIQGLIMACTHYPLITEDIEAYYQGKVELFDVMDIVARAVEHELQQAGLMTTEQNSEHEFYVSDYTQAFEKTTRIFFGHEVHLGYYPMWD